MPSNTTPKWSAIKPKLATMPPQELIDLVKFLFDLSNENRLLLTTKLSPEAIGAEVLEPFRKRIVDQFFPSRGLGKLNLRDARQAIRDYRKATSDIVGTLELMMTYVEKGTAFTLQYGDIDEAFYSSLESVLGEIVQILKTTDGQCLYAEFASRLLNLRENASSIGWGYGDTVNEMVAELAEVCDTSV